MMVHFRIKLLLLLLGTLLLLYPIPSFAKKEKKDLWQTHETLTSRLGAEWYKIGVLKNDLESINDILKDLREFELFPEKITKLYEIKLVTFDKTIEQKEKEAQTITEDLSRLRAPLADAIAILREMVIGKPVEEMFKVIEQGDMERLSQMIKIKHRVDLLWKEIDKLCDHVNNEMGFTAYTGETAHGFEKEFFDIIKANLGQQADEYYKKVNTMKDSLVARASDLEKKQMYKIEIHRIKESLETDKEVITKRKLLLLKERYTDKRYQHEINLLLSQVLYRLGDHYATLEAINLVPDEPSFIADKILYTVQSRYALEEYEKIWEWGESFDFSELTGKDKNLVVWLVMESGLALSRDADFSKLAGQMDPYGAYRLHLFHALSRAYLKDKQPQIALSIYAKALQKEPELEIDRSAYNAMLLSNAQILFETGDYRRSLEYFFRILNKGINFEEALFGIAYCYLNLNQYQKAETALRKLINQSPESRYAAEAILVMTKRFVSKAQYEWKKFTYLSKEEERIGDIIAALSDKIQRSRDKEKIKQYTSGSTRLASVLEQLKTEKREDYTTIRSYYDQAVSVCDIIPRHYETGSFQEVSFSEKRETILHLIDSLLVAIKNEGKGFEYAKSSAGQQRRKIDAIKKLVDKSYSLTAEIQLAQYKWEQECLDWEKMSAAEKIKETERLLSSQKDSTGRQPYIKQMAALAAAIDSLVEKNATLNEYWYNKLSAALSQLVETPLDSTDEIYLRYHLGELYYENENREYRRAYDRYDKKSARYDSLMVLFNEGKLLEMPVAPAAPVLAHTRSMSQFTTVVSKYPRDSAISPSLYSLAWCYNDLGMLDSAVAKMALVARKYPGSAYAPQSWMYLGEYHFDNSRLDSAILAYKSVIKYPESDWFDDALYKLAWSHYRLSNPEKAISSFLALVDLGKEDVSGKALLETESIDYIAISFSECDNTGEKGLMRAKAFCKKLGDNEKAMQILHRLAKVYEDQGRYQIAEKTYTTLVDMYPDYKMNPIVESNLIAVKSRDLPLEEANKYKVDFFRKYNRKSPWAKKQTDTATIALADSAAESQLYDASITYHQLALQKNDNSAYNAALSAYRQFIQYYPSSSEANECHYNLAEILFSTGNYFRAAEEYMAVSKRYPDSKYKETAAWNAIVATQNLLKEEGNKNK